MADDDELEALREQKLEELKRRAEGSTEAEDERSPSAGTPDEPVSVQGPDHYRRFIADHEVVLVDFHAEWCGPCRMLAPVVADLARETDAAVLKVDIDAHQGLAREHQVRGVPTLLLYADGEVVERVTGVREKAALESMVAAAAP